MSSNKDSLMVQSVDTGGQVAEALLKTFLVPNLGLVSDVVSELPFITSAMGLCNAYNVLKSKSFSKKFWAFYCMFSEAELVAFKRVMVARDDAQLGEDVFNALDSVAKDIHARMIARALKLYVSRCEQGEGNDAQLVFDYHMYVIKNLDTYLVSGMTSIYGDNDFDKLASLGKALFYLELVEQETKPSYTSKTEPLISFIVSDKGKDFYQNIILGV